MPDKTPYRVPEKCETCGASIYHACPGPPVPRRPRTEPYAAIAAALGFVGCCLFFAFLAAAWNVNEQARHACEQRKCLGGQLSPRYREGYCECVFEAQ
jgi:hypothetical protein